MPRAIRLFLLAAMIISPALIVSAQTPEIFVCPVTLPNSKDLHGLPGYLGDGKVYTEDQLWIAIPSNGVFEFDPEIHSGTQDPEYAGWIGFKLHVFRGEGVHGYIDITGKRLDEPSDKAPVNDPAVDKYYGETGFVPVALMIPGEGCWEFTAMAGDTVATWVMEVRFTSEMPATPVVSACLRSA